MCKRPPSVIPSDLSAEALAKAEAEGSYFLNHREHGGRRVHGVRIIFSVRSVLHKLLRGSIVYCLRRFLFVIARSRRRRGNPSCGGWGAIAGWIASLAMTVGEDAPCPSWFKNKIFLSQPDCGNIITAHARVSFVREGLTTLLNLAAGISRHWCVSPNIIIG